MDRVRLFWVSAIAISLVGCSSFTSPARYHLLEEGKPYWLDYSAERRGTIIIPKNANNNITVCAEPSPDVALDIVDRFKANVGTGKLTVGAEMDVEEKVIQLAKRTQTIMFLRESLYRLCELSLNYQLDETQVRELYEKVIATAGKMADAELANAQQTKIEAETRKLEIMQKTPALMDEYVKGLKNK